jgi:hypothetical protein
MVTDQNVWLCGVDTHMKTARPLDAESKEIRLRRKSRLIK